MSDGWGALQQGLPLTFSNYYNQWNQSCSSPILPPASSLGFTRSQCGSD